MIKRKNNTSELDKTNRRKKTQEKAQETDRQTSTCSHPLESHLKKKPKLETITYTQRTLLFSRVP